MDLRATSRFSLLNVEVGKEQSLDTLVSFYKLDDFYSTSWSTQPLPSSLSINMNGDFTESTNLNPPSSTKTDLQFKDPLGIYETTKKVPIEDKEILTSDPSLSFTSQNFDAIKFLSVVHKGTPFQNLQLGKQKLKLDMGERTESLRSLVQSNFDAFVAAKNTVDDLYKEMVNNGTDKQNSFGTLPYYRTLKDFERKSQEVFGPIVERTTKSELIRSTLNTIERYKFFFNLPNSLLEYATNSKYELAVKDFKKGLQLMKLNTNPQLDSLFESIWNSVNLSLEKVHLTLTQKLDNQWLELDLQTNYISYLIQLGSKEDPVLYYLNNQRNWIIDYIIQSFTEHIEALTAHYIDYPLPSHNLEDEELELESKLPLHRSQLELLQDKDAASLAAQVEKLPQTLPYQLSTRLINNLSEVVGKLLPDLNRLTEFFKQDSSYKNKFDGTHLDTVWNHIVEEVLALLAITLTKLFNDSTNLNLPAFSSTPNYPKIQSLNQTYVPPSLPNTCCILVVDHYMGKLVTDLVQGLSTFENLLVNERLIKFFKTLVLKLRVDCVSTLTEGWILAAMALDFSKSGDKEMDLVEKQFLFHEKVVNRLTRGFQLMEPLVPELRPEADRAILESALPSLVAANLTTLDTIHNLVFASNSTSTELQLIHGLHLINQFNIKFPDLQAKFRTSMKLTKHLNLTDVKVAAKALDKLVFTNLLHLKSQPVLKLIKRNTNPTFFKTSQNDNLPIEVRPYLYQILMTYVDLHAATTQLSKELTKRTLNKLLRLSTQQLTRCLRDLESVTLQFGLQLLVELKFFQKVLDTYFDDEIRTDYQLVLKTLTEGQLYRSKPLINDMDPNTMKQVDNVVNQATRMTRIQFACLNGNK